MRILSSAALALAGVSAPVLADAPPSSPVAKISVSDFAALPVLKKPILSPDGHRIAARKVADGKTAVVVFEADQPEGPGRIFPLSNVDLFSVQWAGNHRLLLTVMGSQKLFGADVRYLRLVRVDINSGAIQLLDPKSRGILAGEVLYADPTGSWALVASQNDVFSYPSVKRVDLTTGDATVVEKERVGVWDWYADDEGVVRAGVAYSDRRWTVWYRDKAGEKLRALRGKFEKDDEGAVDKFIFRGDKSWIVTNERTGRFGLYQYDTAAGTIGTSIFEPRSRRSPTARGTDLRSTRT